MFYGLQEISGGDRGMLSGMMPHSTLPRNKLTTNVFTPYIPTRDEFFPFVQYLIGADLEDATIGATSIITDKFGYSVNATGNENLTVEAVNVGGGVSNSLGHVANNNILAYWETPSIAPLIIGQQDYTIEVFFQLSSNNIFIFLFQLLNASNNNILRIDRINSGSNQRFDILYQFTTILSYTTTFTPNTSYYMVLQRNSNSTPTTDLYLNGVSVAQVTNQFSLPQVDKIRLGSFQASGGVSGNVGQTRLTVGVPRFTDSGGNNPTTIPVPDSPFPSN